MSKPTEVPEWATETNYDAPGQTWDGTATKVDPGGTLKAEGWQPTFQPPAQYHNWWMGKVGEWLAWVDDRLSIDDGFSDIGSAKLGTDSDARNTPRLQTPYSVETGRYTQITQSVPLGAGPTFRTFIEPVSPGVTDDHAIWHTVNAFWNGSAWQKDANGLAASAVRITGSRQDHFFRPTGTGTWSTWNQTTLSLEHGSDQVTVPSTMALQGAVSLAGTEEYAYASARSRLVNIGGAVPLPGHSGWTVASTGNWTGTPGSTIRFPFAPPTGTTITRVQVNADPSGAGAAVSVRLWRVRASSFAEGSQSRTQIGSTETSSGTVAQTLTIGSLSEVVNRATDWYYVEAITGGSGTSVTLGGIELQFSDPGPRNH
jgi:hypothetical protein